MTDTHVAIVGIAGRFPGATDVSSFWSNLKTGVDSVTRQEPDPAAGHVPAYGVVVGSDLFDASFFGCSSRDALMLDPQHRVFMECAWEALEDAGCDPTRYHGQVGVYGGSGDTDHFATLRAQAAHFPGITLWQMRLASGADFLTSRVAYKIGLTGPAVTVQTACSTSLVATHLAIQALLAGECDLALAGGATIHMNHPFSGSDNDGVLARDGYCRPFDAQATGTVGADGAGVVALKRLADALEEGDQIYAVILGSVVNNDGSAKIGFTAPGVDGQAAAVRAAHLVAGVDPASIGYVEAHGTGTPVGDPIEVRALSKAFRRRVTDEPVRSAGDDAGESSCVLGSVKANIGHTDAAAGVIGLIKTALCLRNELIPATPHFASPNPGLELDGSPFVIAKAAVKWPRSARPRRAGVNSLGLGGTNAHVVVEEAPVLENKPGRPYQVLPISARSRAELTEVAARLGGCLADPDLAIDDAAWTLQTGRKAFSTRSFVVASGRDEAVRRLEDSQTSPLPVRRAEVGRQVSFLFPGQGGQSVGMGRELYRHEPAFRTEIDRCAELAADRLGLDIRDILYPDADDHEATTRIKSMAVAQPTLFALEYALARLWQSWGITPSSVLGHSLGAYAAATIAGVLTVEGAMTLVLTRGELFDGLAPGAMLAVSAAEREITNVIGDGISIAAVNSSEQVVLAGPIEAVERLHASLQQQGRDVRLLHVSAAAHSELVEPVVGQFEQVVAGIALRPPTVTWISDRTGQPVTAAQACDPRYWGEHLRHTVRFHDALTTMLRDDASALLEIGPGRTLGALAQRHPGFTPDRPVVSCLPHPADPVNGAETMMAAVGRLWQSGVDVDWAALHSGERRRRVSLPSYPFQRRLFRLDAIDLDQDIHALDTHAEDYVAPVTPSEIAISTAFAKVLGGAGVGVHTHFFESGGDSLSAKTLLTLLRSSLDSRRAAQLNLAMIFQAPTVRSLAAAVDTADGGPDNPQHPSRIAARSPWMIGRRGAATALQLYCFPHSGGSAGEFVQWLSALPDVQACGFQPPGRGARLAEDPWYEMSGLVSSILDSAAFVEPFVLFGHSLGALVAYEVAHALAQAGRTGPAQLIVSGMPAPHRHDPGTPVYLLDDAALVEEIRLRYDTLPPEFDDPELRQIALKGLRADLSIVDTYRHVPRPPLGCPIVALGGAGDEPTVDDLREWRGHTTADVVVRLFPGDHFYYREKPNDVLSFIADELPTGVVPRPGPLGLDAPVPRQRG